MGSVPWWHGCQGLPRSAKAGDEIDSHPLNKKCLQRRNRQIQDNLHLVRPIARHYALQTGLDQDDLLQVGCLGLIKASNRFETKRGTTFPSFAKPHIRGTILHFLRDKVGVIRLPRAVEERAMRMLRNPEGCLNAADALVVHQYRSKHHWVEFNDDLVDDTPQGIELVARQEAWKRVRTMFLRIGTDEQRVLQMVVIDGMSLRQASRQLGISAMTVQRRVKRGLRSLASQLNEDQAWV